MRKVYSFIAMLLLVWTASVSMKAQPQFSSDGDDHWYYIQFYRVLNLYSRNLVIQNNGAAALLSQSEFAPGSEAQQWKLEGTAESFAVVSKTGEKWLVNSDSKYEASASSASSFYLGTYSDGGYVIQDHSNDAYVNDQARATVCLYGYLDNGARITFIPADEKSMQTSAENISCGRSVIGVPVKKTVSVSGVALSEAVSYTITGDASVFTLTESVAFTANGGELEIAFTPAAAQEYNATLTFSADDLTASVALTGSGVALPVQISDASNEYWYYLQFYRATGTKVIQSEGLDQQLSQTPIVPGADNQLWKFTGAVDELSIVSKDNDMEILYDATWDATSVVDRYTATESEYGNFFTIMPFSTTTDWIIYNNDAGKFSTAGVMSTTQRYLNDISGKAVGNYTAGDAGSRLVFIPATQTNLLVGATSIAFGSLPTDNTLTKSVVVTGLNLSGTISYSFTGSDAAAFTATATETGVDITFDPDEARAYTANLVATADGISKTIALTGTGIKLPIKFSTYDATTEYWYYIQFNRSANLNKVITDAGEDAVLTQEERIDPADDSQWWKFVGNKDTMIVVSKTGHEIKYVDDDNENFVAAAAGTGDTLALAQMTDGTWMLVMLTPPYSDYPNYIALNDQNRVAVCLYYTEDSGDPLTFIPANAAAITPAATSLDLGFAEITTTITASLAVTGSLLTGDITVTVGGADADAFSVDATVLPAEGGTLVITFAPTVSRDYKAKLILSSEGAEDVDVILTATAEFPVVISTDGDEHWYLISFYRRSGTSWDVTSDSLRMMQKTTNTASAAQYWKFVGGPTTGYSIVNYATGKGLYYVQSADNYYFVTEAQPEPNYFRFVPFSTTEDWQFLDLTYMAASGGTESSWVWLNDKAAQYACTYSKNDAGNRIVFTAGTPPSQGGGEGIVSPSIDLGEKIATRYYTLQGVRVDRPVSGGIYIRQDIYSQRSIASKVLVK
ncbi:MAG: hypothetical protein LBR66_01535 [Candidatus Symbiothrix sp.]|jgi:hypothetical protein|nr:hypothetical protein [Candidatus Symbiothrix sp.]